MRNLVVHALAATLDAAPLDPDQVVHGDPQVSAREILADDAVAVGIWQHTAGVSTDVEADEVFVVLSGSATIVIDGGPTLAVGPGDVGVLAAGARTTWTVHEDLRKVYVVRPS
ncbi:MAG TPA: cupin domain-containing protein [Actinomycetes bacterium]|nr:cupin domain-containing protein [Actinomycetes bacterium]